MELSFINWWAVFFAMAVAMGIGSLWYSSFLFGTTWQHEIDKKRKELGDPMVAMLSAALMMLLGATTLAILIGLGDVMAGMRIGALIGLGLVATSLGVHYSYENRSLKLFLINAGYMVVALSAMGAIIGAWH